MLKLSKECFEKAVEFIRKSGRPLERELYNYYFAGGSREAVLRELARFQNEDGGFGHGLESDVRLGASSNFVTSVGFQFLTELNVGKDNEIVQKGIKYLIKNYKPELKGWLYFPPEVDAEPRAAWWNYNANTENIYEPNPSAEIAGYLSRYSELVSEEILSDSVETALAYLDEHIENIDMHDIYCYQRMAEQLQKEQAEAVINKLRRRIRKVIEFNSNNWSGYAARPLSFIQSPEDPLCSEVSGEELGENLDYMIREQKEDGSWEPRWHWGRFSEDWEIARKEWSGVITLDNLRILRNFNRVE